MTVKALKKNNMERKSKGTMAYKLKSQDHGGPMKKNFPSVFKETEEEFLARMKLQGISVSPSITVEGTDTRDIIAKQIRSGYSGRPNPGMEQSVRSKSYREAEEYLAKRKKK